MPIVKYYTAQVCLAQGIAVLQDQMAEIPLVNFLGLKIVSIESYSSYIIIWETLKSLAYSTLLKSTSLKNIFNCLCQTVINYRLTRTTRLKRKLICKCIKFLQFDNGIWITLPSYPIQCIFCIPILLSRLLNFLQTLLFAQTLIRPFLIEK